MTTEAEMVVVLPQVEQYEGLGQLPEAREKRREALSLGVFREHGQLDLGFWTRGLLNCERINFCYGKAITSVVIGSEVLGRELGCG